MGTDLPWAAHPGLTASTAQHCQAQQWSELSARPRGLTGCQSRFYQGSVWPTGLSREQLPLLHAGCGCQEKGTQEPPRGTGQSVSAAQGSPETGSAEQQGGSSFVEEAEPQGD